MGLLPVLPSFLRVWSGGKRSRSRQVGPSSGLASRKEGGGRGIREMLGYRESRVGPVCNDLVPPPVPLPPASHRGQQAPDASGPDLGVPQLGGSGSRWGTGYAGGVRASLPRPGTLLLLSRLLPLTRPCGTGGFRACSGCSAAGVVGLEVLAEPRSGHEFCLCLQPSGEKRGKARRERGWSTL